MATLTCKFEKGKRLIYVGFDTEGTLIGLRVSREVELKGLDITEHGTDVYSGFQIFSNE